MKNPAPRSFISRRRVLIAALLVPAAAQLHAAEISRANISTALNLTGSWVGGVVPGSGDIAVFDSTLTADRAGAIGNNLSFGGIKVTNAGGTVHTINTTTGMVLTLGSSGIDMSTATANLAITANMDLSASQTWTVASGRALTVQGVNTGVGTIGLSGGGTFSINNNASLGNGTVNFGDGITLTNTSSRVLANAASLTGNISVSLVGPTNNSLTLNGNLALGSSNRTITLTNPNMVWAATSTATSSMLALGNNGTQLTGTGTLTLANSGASPMVGVRFAPANYVQSDVVIGSGVAVAVTTANAFTANGTLTVNSGGRFSLSSGGSTALAQTVASLSGAGTVTKDAVSTHTAGTVLTIDGGVRTSATTFSGVIQDGSGSVAGGARLGLTKTGATTQILSGVNTYTGQTLVSGGSLFVNGSHLEAAAVTQAFTGYNTATFGHYQVGTGATLGGSGRIAGFNATTNANMVLVQSNGTLAPGGDNTFGTLVLDGGNISGTTARVLNMASGSRFDFTLSGDGSSSDKLAFWNFATSDLLLNSNVVDLSLSGTQTGGTHTVTLFSFFSDAGTTSIASIIGSGLTLGTLGAGIESASFTYNPSSIDVTYTVAAIPEPSTAAGLLGFAALFGAAVRRRAKRS